MSLSKKMMVIAAVFFISAVLLTAFSYSFIARTVQGRVKESGMSQVSETAHTFSEFFSKLISMTSALAASMGSFVEAAPEADPSYLLVRYFESLREEGVSNVFMAFDTGEFIDAAGRSCDPGAGSWYEETLAKDRAIIPRPFAHPKTGELIVSITAPAYSSGGALTGVFGLNLELSHLKKRIEEEKVFGEGNGFLIDRTGSVLIPSLPGQELAGDVLAFSDILAPVVKTLPHEGIRSEKATFMGESHILFYAPAGEYFSYGFIYPESSFRRFVLEIAVHHLVAWLVILALAAALFVPAAKEFITSFSSLSTVADSFAAGLSRSEGPGEVSKSVRILADEIGGAVSESRIPEFRCFLGSMRNALDVIGKQGDEIASLTEQTLAMQDSLIKANSELLERQKIWRSTLSVMETVSHGGDSGPKFRRIVETIRHNAGAFGVFLANYKDGSILPLAASGYRSSARTDVIPHYQASVAARAMRKKKPIWVENVENDPDYCLIHPEVVSELEIPLIHSGKEVGILEVAFSGEPRERDQELIETLMPVASAIAGLLDVDDSRRDVKESYRYLTEKLRSVTEIYHLETGDHMDRIGAFSRLAAKALGKSQEEQNDIELFSRLHDLGKMRIPISILGKNGPLTDEEMAVVRMHPQWGAEIIGDARWLEAARKICLTHHEKWDGSGYPMGLAGEEIPWEGQVVALADVYDALRSNRVYKGAMSHEEAVRVILEGDGRTSPAHFSPEMLEFFRRNHQEMDKIFNSLSKDI